MIDFEGNLAQRLFLAFPFISLFYFCLVLSPKTSPSTCARIPAACQQRSGAAGQEGCLPWPGSSSSRSRWSRRSPRRAWLSCGSESSKNLHSVPAQGTGGISVTSLSGRGGAADDRALTAIWPPTRPAHNGRDTIPVTRSASCGAWSATWCRARRKHVELRRNAFLVSWMNEWLFIL